MGDGEVTGNTRPAFQKEFGSNVQKHLTDFGRPVARDGGWRNEHCSVARARL
jgi:hypothetical protein